MVSPSLAAHRDRGGVPHRLRGLAVTARVQRPRGRASRGGPACSNYTDALQSSEFWAAVKTTFIFTGFSVFFETLLGLAMALAMHSAFKGQGLLRTVVLVPWAVLTVVTAITWQTIFEPTLGFVNSLLGAIGLPGRHRAGSVRARRR